MLENLVPKEAPQSTGRQALMFLFALSDVLRRCLLPIVGALLFTALIHLPQTREFFRELLLVCASEPGRCGQTIGTQATAQQFLIFEALSLVFSFLVWYSCRMLVSYRASPSSAVNHASALLACWLPRIIGMLPVFMVSLTMLQHVDAGWSNVNLLQGLVCSIILVVMPFALHVKFPTLFGRRKLYLGLSASILGIVFCAIHPIDTSYGNPSIFLPWLIVLVCYAICAWRVFSGFWHRILSLALIELVTGFAFIEIGLAAGSATGLQKWTWTVAVAILTPAVYLAVVMFRRHFAWNQPFRAWFARLKPGSAIIALLHRLAPRLPWHCVLFLLAASFLGCLISYVVVLDPVTSSQWLFTPAVLLLWLTVALLLAMVFRFVIPVEMQFAAITIFAYTIYSDQVPDAPLKAVEAAIPGDPCTQSGVCSPDKLIPQQFKAWQQKRGGDADTGPVILVAAAGGGSRAAAHTSARLAAADAGSCGMFGDRVFAISAVSGGALGAASYIALRRDLADLPSDRTKCLQSNPDARGAPLITPLTKLAAEDHLSATLIRALFRDLPKSLIPPAWRNDIAYETDYLSRAGTLTTSWLRNYQDMLEHERQFIAQNKTLPRVSGSFLGGRELTTSQPGAGPLVLFNATSVQDGRRVIMSLPMMCPEDAYCARQSGDLLEDAIDSARFPVISPARNRDVYGWNQWQSQRVMTQRSVVDGGYFDNSGVVTLNEVIDGLLADPTFDRTRIVVVLITSNPEEGEPVRAVSNFADSGLRALVQGPAQAIVNVRDGRTEQALQELRKRLGTNNVIHWSLSEQTLNALEPEIAAGRQKSADQIAYEKVHGDPRAERPLRDAPPLAWALSRDSANFIWRYASGLVRVYANPTTAAYTAERQLAQQLIELQPANSVIRT